MLLGLKWMKNYCIAFDWSINSQHYLQHCAPACHKEPHPLLSTVLAQSVSHQGE